MLEAGDIREVNLADLVVSRGQVRLREVGKEIEELAASIEKVGLLEPIVVCPSDKPGKLEILTGQRRVLAHRQLGRTTILARVLTEQVDETKAKTISLTENMVRRDLNRSDLIDACTSLYKKYGSINAVINETGLPRHKVSEYVKYDRLIPELRKMVDEGLEIKTALRAQDAASPDGELNTTDAVALARDMSKMSKLQQMGVVKRRNEDPTVPIGTAVEEAMSGEVFAFTLAMGAGLKKALNAYAKAEGTDQSDAALTLIEEGLSTKGFVVE